VLIPKGIDQKMWKGGLIPSIADSKRYADALYEMIHDELPGKPKSWAQANYQASMTSNNNYNSSNNNLTSSSSSSSAATASGHRNLLNGKF
jgi:hypothetical protein